MQRTSSIFLFPASVVAALGIWAVLHLPVGSAGLHEWLPVGRPERQRYESFLRRFGSDQVVLLSWNGCTVDDVRLKQFRKSLTEHPLYSTLFLGVDSSDQIFGELTSPPLKLSAGDAARRLRGVFVGENGTAMMLIRVGPRGVARQSESIQLLQDLADEIPGLRAKELKIVGTVFESNAIDQAAERSLRTLVLPSTLLGLLICWYCLGSWRAAWTVLLLAVIGQLISVELVYYTGNRFSAVLIVLPTLIFMLTLSGAVHLANYYWEIPDGKNDGARGAATVLLGWRPCVLSSFTTMLGMGSLVLSQLAPVRQFGLYAALGLGLATTMLLLAFPAVADFFFRCRISGQPRRNAPRLSFPKRALDRYVRLQTRRATWISGLGVILLMICFPGVVRLRSSTKFCDMFSAESRISSNMQWFEQNVGPISGTEVLVHFDQRDQVPTLEQVSLVREVVARLNGNPDVGGALSVVTFLPRWSNVRSVKGTVSRTLIGDHIQNHFDKFQEMGLAHRDTAGTTWRILSKVSATSRKSYGDIASGISAITKETLDKSPWRAAVHSEVTGLSPVMHETQVALLTDLLYSFLGAFVMITPVMICMARSIWGGMVLMVPNVLPVALVFGSIGTLGWSLDVAGILTASIALGIAVDDTLHFVNWYLWELANGVSKPEAIRNTFASCATAMCHTSIICCGTMVPFAFADFVPTRHFAVLMIAMLATALAGDLVLLPALLLSPLGRFVTGRGPRPNPSNAPIESTDPVGQP